MKWLFKKQKSKQKINDKLYLSADKQHLVLNLRACLHKEIFAEEVDDVCLLLKSVQGILSMDDGIPRDFELVPDKTTLMVTGNFKTALYVFRHAGLISIPETEMAFGIVDRVMNETLPGETYVRYEAHAKKVAKDFIDSAQLDYQSAALAGYFKVG